jgi:tRNA (mo5U34)-methyltransferase
VLARRALGSSVRRVELSVYELSPEALGRFDFVFMGALLLHLRDPVGALRAVRTVTAGEFLSADHVSLPLTLISPRAALATLGGPADQLFWWRPNIAAHKCMLSSAGFRIERSAGPYFVPFGAGLGKAPSLRELIRRRRLHRLGSIAFRTFTRRAGVSCAWALCQPAV